MGGVAVLQKGLHKKRKVPMAHKKENYYRHIFLSLLIFK